MLSTGLFSTNLEWPAPDARVAGPVVWLRGWAVGHGDIELVDVRARTRDGVFLGVLGLPRVDLAAHFAPGRAWLPAEYVVAVAAPDGPCAVVLEAQDAHGRWLELQSVAFTVAPDGAMPTRTDGKFLPGPGGGEVERVPHLPLHGHLDDPADGAALADGVLPVFGWFVHDEQRVTRVSATFDARVFTVVASGLTDDVLAQKLPHLPAARHGRVRGTVPYFVTLPTSACLRVYVELADGSVQLAPAGRRTPAPAAPLARPAAPALPQALLPQLPSGRPRRLLVALRTLRPDDATGRALDVVTALIRSGRWAVRAVAAEDGPLNAAFEAAGCAVQQVDLRAYTAARGAAADAELAALDRTIWWGHLDAVAVFDDVSEWIRPLAARRGLPVFRDPADTLIWAPLAPTPWQFDAAGPFVAPIRGLAAHGAPTLLALAGRLPGGTELLLTDGREDDEEEQLRASLAGRTDVRLAPMPAASAALVCPAWRDHPLRAILAATAAGAPVVTTPHPLLRATFAAGELTFVEPGNPLALQHALADLRARPEAAARRADAARRVTAQHHAPSDALAHWLRALEATVAAR